MGITQYSSTDRYIEYSISIYLDTAAAAAKSLQSCLTLCDPMDCSPPGFSVHGILQARTLEYYSAIKRNEILIPVLAWINLGNYQEVPHWRSMLYGSNYMMYPEFYKFRKQLVPACGWWGWHKQVPGKYGVTANRDAFLLGVSKMFKNWLWWRLSNSMNTLKALKSHPLNRWIVWYINSLSIKLLYMYINIYYIPIKDKS